jgi:hypothetical protein
MTKPTLEDKIQQQRDRFNAPDPMVSLISPCRINEGILTCSQSEKENYRKSFKIVDLSVGYFIPASGSGSRMFQFLYEYLSDPKEENQALVERFVNAIDQFAFYSKLPTELRTSVEKGDFRLDDLILEIIGKNGLGLGSLPKGLIPFHKLEPFILNPFQEQLLQGVKLSKKELSFHFTIQEDFTNEFKSYVKVLEDTTGITYETTFSVQETATNAIAFLEDGAVCKDKEGNMVSRPAGHGSLLHNLAHTKGDILFIKNIDNVQHYEQSEKTVETWELLGGVLTEFRREAALIFSNPDNVVLAELNKKFQLVPEEELIHYTSVEEIKELLDRPVRVCGMVRNQGQPGGGPFWVKEQGRVTKQIVEKAQIAATSEQLALLVKSTHFNPVMIAACQYDFEGNKYDINEFVDHSKYFKVSKTHQGQKIGYIELPGLWNGSMAHWNSIFVEIPSEVFSPVKTILDLLEDAHKA